MKGAALTALRSALFVTQRELAELLGVHEVTVGKWERGVSRPTHWQADVLEVLASAPELARPGLRSEGSPAVRLARALTAAASSVGAQPALSRSGARGSAGLVGTP